MPRCSRAGHGVNAHTPHQSRKPSCIWQAMQAREGALGPPDLGRDFSPGGRAECSVHDNQWGGRQPAVADTVTMRARRVLSFPKKLEAQTDAWAYLGLRRCSRGRARCMGRRLPPGLSVSSLSPA